MWAWRWWLPISVSVLFLGASGLCSSAFMRHSASPTLESALWLALMLASLMAAFLVNHWGFRLRESARRRRVKAGAPPDEGASA